MLSQVLLSSSGNRDVDGVKRNSLCLRRGSMPTDNSLAPPLLEDKRASRRGSLFVTSAYADSQERLIVPKSMDHHQRQHEAKDLRRRSSPSAPVHPAKMAAALSKADAAEIGDKKHQTSALKQIFHRTSTDSGNSSNIEVHGYSNNPTEAWEWLKQSNVIWPVKIKKPPDPVPENVARFVCMSDTHGRPLNPQSIPNGDVLIMAGDFTSCGHPQEIRAFDEFLGHLPHPYKLVVCGNHELTFNHDWTPTVSLFPTIEKMLKMDRLTAVQRVFREALKQAGVINPRQLLTNCTLLEDSGVTLFDLNIFGSPWLPNFDDWAYNLPRGRPLLEKWNAIPSKTDILITHTPPAGCCDKLMNGQRAGCVELLNTVRKRVQPKYHIFGHIHEGYGCATDGTTKFMNACSLDSEMRMINPPMVFDVPLQLNQPKSYYLRSDIYDY